MSIFGHYDPWSIRLESHASPCTPQDAVDHLQRHADRLGITVIGDVNGREIMATPHRAPPAQISGEPFTHQSPGKPGTKEEGQIQQDNNPQPQEGP